MRLLIISIIIMILTPFSLAGAEVSLQKEDQCTEVIKLINNGPSELIKSISASIPSGIDEVKPFDLDNALIVKGTKSAIEQFKVAVKELDVPSASYVVDMQPIYMEINENQDELSKLTSHMSSPVWQNKDISVYRANPSSLHDDDEISKCYDMESHCTRGCIFPACVLESDVYYPNTNSNEPLARFWVICKSDKSGSSFNLRLEYRINRNNTLLARVILYRTNLEPGSTLLIEKKNYLPHKSLVLIIRPIILQDSFSQIR